MNITVTDMATVHAPPGEAGRQLWYETECRNAKRMNDLFCRYFGLNQYERYMGSFPYPNRETGRCNITHVLSMSSREMRDAIVASLRAVISDAGLPDIVVEKDEGARSFQSPWPYTMKIVAIGDSITDNLVGEQRVQALLDLFEAWLTRA